MYELVSHYLTVWTNLNHHHSSSLMKILYAINVVGKVIGIDQSGATTFLLRNMTQKNLWVNHSHILYYFAHQKILLYFFSNLRLYI